VWQRLKLLNVLVIVGLIGVWASESVTAQATPTAEAAGTANKKSIESLVQVLEDKRSRDSLIGHLRALYPTLPSDAAADLEAKDQLGVQGGPNLNVQLAVVADQQTELLLGILGNIGGAFSEIWRLPSWFEHQLTDKGRRAFWLEVMAGGLVLPIFVALFARWMVRLWLSGAVRRLRDNTPDDLRGRLFTGITRSVLEAASVAAVLGAGYAVLALVDRSVRAHQLAVFMIQAIAVLTGSGVLARLILAPYADALRPVPLASVTAAYLYLWVMRLAWAGCIGFVVSKAAIPLGANPAGAHAVGILAAIVFAGLTMILVMQARDPVAAVIRGGRGGLVRRRLADIWHVLAIIYVLLVFGVFVSEAQDGFVYLIRATGITAASIIAAVIASLFFDRLLHRIFALDPELDDRFPGLRTRSNLYRPVLKRGIDLLLVLAVFVALLAGWDLGLLEALSPELRLTILKSSGTIIFVLVLCVLAWELASGAISRSLTGSGADGTDQQPGSRAKTLLPLLRRAIFVVLVVFGGLVILAEIGIQIAPLLAGAGVVGLAIGFGSQALVRDVITGLFILIEDTIAVGDFVTVGGHSGTVEDLSIRTIKLRDLSGTVHTVPFGDVTTVENFTKDFSYAVLDIGVGYGEDTDVVSAVLGEIGVEILADDVYGERIIGPMEIMGVHELGDSAVVIRARVKTKPMLQWGVRREFYRRIKKRFDMLGIEIPFPHQTVYFGQKKSEPSAAMEQYRLGPGGRSTRAPDGSPGDGNPGDGSTGKAE